MSKLMTRFFLAALLLLESIPSGAQSTKHAQTSTMSLNQAIQYGLDHHHSALNAADDIESAGARIREITSIGLPQIRATYGLTDNFIIQRSSFPTDSCSIPMPHPARQPWNFNLNTGAMPT